MTICTHAFTGPGEGWRIHKWQPQDCSAGLPQSDWVSIGEARNPALGAGGQAECAWNGVGYAAHYNNPYHIGTTPGELTCIYVSPSHPDVTVCSHWYGSPATGWLTPRVWIPTDCSNGLPGSDWIPVGSAANGAGFESMTECRWSGVTSASLYVHPWHVGPTTGMLRCMYVRPGAPDLTVCRHTWPLFESGWRAAHAWQAAECSSGTPLAGAAYMGEARTGAGIAAMSSCSYSGVSTVSQHQHPYHAGETNGLLACVYKSPRCGNGVCERGESCLTCGGDCGACPVCAPVRRYVYTLPADVALSCSATSTLFDVTVPDQGYALARFKGNVRSAPGGAVHFWNTNLTVGATELGFGIGDDVCPGTTALEKANLGYGLLSLTQNRVQVFAHQGSSSCQNGQLTIVAGAQLEVWVEDPAPACQKQDITVDSYYAESGFPLYQNLHYWNAYMSPIHERTVTVTNPAEDVLVMSVVEGTPPLNPNTTCGAEWGTLASEILVDGAIVDQRIQLIPASGGMGHLVMSTAARRTLARGSHFVQMRIGKNVGAAIHTGGCCGDAVLGIVRRAP